MDLSIAKVKHDYRDDGTYLLLFTFQEGKRASDVQHWRHEDGLLARVFVDQDDEPIAIRLRDQFDAQTLESANSDAQEVSEEECRKVAEKTAKWAYSLACYLVLLSKERREEREASRENEPDLMDDPESPTFPSFDLSDDAASVVDRIIGFVPPLGHREPQFA